MSRYILLAFLSTVLSVLLRVDAAAEFYVRVQPSKEGVATAAQALGSKSFRSAELAEVNAAFDALQGHGPKRDAQPGAVSLRVVVPANGATDACGRAIRGYLAARPIIAAA